MRSAAWLVNRLKVMPPGEVALRLGRVMVQRREKARVHRGWSPAEGVRLRGTRRLFPGPDCLADYLDRFELDWKELEALTDNQLLLFGRRYRLGAPVNWHRDPSTGTVAPLGYGKFMDYRDERLVGNVKTLWEPARHQHLVPLAVAYAVTGRVEYRQAIVRQIDSWLDQNPFGRGIHWCSSLEIALRGIAWTMIHALLQVRDGTPGLLQASSDPPRLTRSLFEHGHFVRRHLSRFSSANNHLIGELVGLWCLARVFDFGPASADWEAVAAAELPREAERQVTDDGVAREQAVHYHLEVMEYLLYAWCIGAATGRFLPATVLERVASMAAYLRVITPQRDLPPRIGDSDDATVNRITALDPSDPYADVLAAVDAVLQPTAAPRTQKAYWYQLLVRDAGVSAFRPTEPPRKAALTTFPQGGYAVIRADDVLAVFDAGPLGYPAMAAHGHADALSLCLAWQGRWWLIDPGTFAYHDQPRLRSYFRSTAAHNTLRVNGIDQSRMGGPFLWTSRAPAELGPSVEAPDELVCRGHHDGYAALGVRHRRELRYLRRAHSLEICDRVEVANEHPLTLDLFFHFSPDVSLTLEGNRAVAVREDCSGRLVMSLDSEWQWQQIKGSEAPLLGWYSPRFGCRQPCWTLQGCRHARGTIATVATLHFELGGA